MSSEPTTSPPRVIILCFDGTSNQYGAQVSQLHVSSCVTAKLTCKTTRTQTSSSSTLCSTSVVRSNRLSITRFVPEPSLPSLPPFRLKIPSLLIRLAAWGRDFLQPRSRQSCLDMARKDSRRGDCLVHCSYPTVVCPNLSRNFPVFRYLSAHVMEGYKFLMQNYRAGDKICLFGAYSYPTVKPQLIDVIAPPAPPLKQVSLEAPTPHVPWQDSFSR
jgi:hypothetical protein